MQFDPTYNYGDDDLTADENLVRWKFSGLIKSLITLSSPAERQVEIVGVGATCDEMADDFHTYFTLSYRLYLEFNLLSTDQVEKIKQLDDFFDERSGDVSPAFWEDFLLETNPEWEIVRQKALDILKSLGIQDLTLKFDREEKCEITDEGKRLTIQSTKSRLERKNAS